MGITGGLIEIAACFNNLTGKLALFLIKKIIKIQISSQNYIENEEDSNNEDFVI